MRVYGSSPLFNYVELIFRSRRLFVVSVVLATLATTAFYYSRTKTYSARMIVFMTGSETVGPVDDTQRGSIGYKINTLNALLRDPNFIKKAMSDGNLHRGKSEMEFAEFCKKVPTALTYAAEGNILEISCHWPSPECADIIKSVYSLYNQRVFEDETVLNTTRTDLLKVMFNEYSNKHHALDLKVRDYQLDKMARRNTMGFEASNAQYQASKDQVEALTEDLQGAQKQRASIEAELAKTPKTMIDTQVFNGFAQSDDLKRAKTAQNDALLAFNEEKAKHTENDPRYKASQAKYDEATAAVAKLNKQADEAGSAHKASDLATTKESANPQYQSLQTRLSDQILTIASLQNNLQKAQGRLAEVNQRLNAAPDEALKYKTMTADMGLYSKMQDELRAELESAHLNELRDNQLKTKEMRVDVQPEAEPEQGGARAALLLGAGPILGLIVAFCFSLLSESLDHSLRTPMEVEKFLNKPVLAVLPRMDTKKTRHAQLGSGDNNNRPSLPS